MDDFPKVLVRDSVLDMVTAVYGIDAAEMIRNAPGRYSIVPWAPSSVPAGQKATIQSDGAGGFALAHHVAHTAGTPTR